MKVRREKFLQRLAKLIVGRDLDLSAVKDPRLKSDILKNNIFYSITASILVCILALIGVIGSVLSLEKGYVLSGVNATSAYLILFLTNVVFLRLVLYEQKKPGDDITRGHAALIFHLFCGINMVLASLTFFTTQRNSSFFFEYILVTIIVYLLPLSDIPSFIRNAAINIVTMIFVLCFLRHNIAWQDLVDIVALHLICGFVNWVRWISFLHTEGMLFSIESTRDLYYTKSRTDALTTLLNRYALRKDFPGYINQKLSLALIDLDSFKQYNDNYGHEYGDKVLEKTGKKLRHVFHDYEDRCYRYGGDEFLIISRDNAQSFSQKLREFQNSCAETGDDHPFTCSIGYCVGIPHAESDLRALIKIADNYLYKAKSDGKGTMQGTLSLVNASIRMMTDQLLSPAAIKNTDDAVKFFTQNKMAGKSWSIAYLNVNRFAEINETIGTRNGQIILQAILNTLLRNFPDSILFTRELDHFVLYATVPDSEFTDRIRKVQSDVAALESSRVVILRAGIYHHHDTDAPADFITGMYNARYAANQAYNVTSGDNYLCIYDAVLEQKRARENFVHNNFIAALEAGHFVPYYQPIVGSLSGTTCGFEALSRWIDPEKGMISPADYVPYLEESFEAYRLDLYLLEQVCRDIRKYSDKFPRKLFVNVNLSQTDFKIMNMPEEIERIVSRYGIPREQIQFEITESAFAETNVIHDAVKQLNEHGYRVWMDDFGVGESSLSAFHNYEVQGVKIDQSFFRDLSNQRTKIIIQSIVDLCHETGSMMIAEGIETREQLWYAQQWGMNFIQGFFFSRPIPLKDLIGSPFVSNVTDEDTDRFYKTMAEVSLVNNLPFHYQNPQNHQLLLLARAVIVLNPDQQLALLRIDKDMQDLLKGSVIAVNKYQYSLRQDFSLYAILTDVIRKVDAKHPAFDFSVELNNQKYHAMLSFLAEKNNGEMAGFLLTLANFVIAP